MNKSDNLSLLEVAIEYMTGKKTPQKISKIIEDVLSIKGLDADDYDSMAKLYSDITTSAKFVFCGDDNWDLKERQSLDLWDKDGSYFNNTDDDYEDEIDEDSDETTLADYSLNDDLEEEEKDLDDFDDSDDDEDDDIIDHDEDDDDYLDEDKYNDMMDDYEDLYEDD